MNATKAKQEAKARDEWECQFCGMDNENHNEEYGRSLHAHHIVKQSIGGPDDPQNLITVCRGCHDTLEATQAKGLKILDQQPDEIEQQRNALLERVEQLERAIRSPEFFAEMVGPTSAHGEVVSKSYGPRIRVTGNHDDAVNAYQEWGSQIKRVTLQADKESVSEAASEIVGDTRRTENILRCTVGRL